MNIVDIFKMPKPVNITGRTSTITNSFVTSIIPCISPTTEQLRECLQILGLDQEDLRCAYCGDKSTEWDHLRPIVKGKKPTGYISDIYITLYHHAASVISRKEINTGRIGLLVMHACRLRTAEYLT